MRKLKVYLSNLDNTMQSISTIEELNIKVTSLEQKIKELEKQHSNFEIYKRFFNESKDLVCIANLDGFFKFVNPTFSACLGYTNEELLSRPFTDLTHPDDIQRTFDEINFIRNTGKSTFKFENRYIAKDGKIVFLEWVSSIDEENQIIFAIARDITLKKEIETKLLKSENLMATAQKMAKIGSFSFELETQQLFWSDELYEIYEIDKHKNQDLYSIYLSHFKDSDRQKLFELIDNSIQTGDAYTIEHPIFFSDGREKWVLGIGNPIKDAFGKIFKIEGAAQDITNIIKAQKKIIRSEDLLKTSQKIAKLGSWSINTLTKEIYWSDELFNIYCADKNASIDYYQHFCSLIDQEEIEILNKLVENAYSNGESYSREINLTFNDGSQKWIKITGVPIKDENGTIIGLKGITHDLTEIKKSQLTILNIVKEKEILLKELHHRVKNNMQVISSMLNLQASMVKDPSVKDIFQNCQMRIKSMSDVHNMLYNSDSISNINFPKYINTIIEDLIFFYRGSLNTVKTNIKVPEIYFNLDIAVPLGLLINEIITNSLKHGISNSENAEISCTIKSIDENQYFMEIKDNGVGFNKDIESLNSSMGLLIIESIVSQIDGRLFYESDENGTRYQLKF